MKMVVGFVSGIIICCLVLFGVRDVLPVNASADEAATDNNTSLVGLLPDIEKIYHEALTAPFKKAESQIYDEEIAEFYRDLMDSTGLDGGVEGTN